MGHIHIRSVNTVGLSRGSRANFGLPERVGPEDGLPARFSDYVKSVLARAEGIKRVGLRASQAPFWCSPALEGLSRAALGLFSEPIGFKRGLNGT